MKTLTELTMKNNKTKIVFFGTPQLSLWALQEMENAGIVPNLIVTAPAKPAGRGRVLTNTPVYDWASQRKIKTLTPQKIDSEFKDALKKEVGENSLFVVYAYGKILPKDILDIPKYGVINLHPSLLPKLRGPSPIRTAILQDQKNAVGISIIFLDEKMDHGPVLFQKKIPLKNWPISGLELDKMLSKEGGKALAEIIPSVIAGEIVLKEQEHKKATYCQFFKKEDAKINLNDDPYKNLLKIYAFEGWPVAYFEENGKKVKITKARLEDGKLKILKVIPEGKKEMNYEDYLRGRQNNQALSKT